MTMNKSYIKCAWRYYASHELTAQISNSSSMLHFYGNLYFIHVFLGTTIVDVNVKLSYHMRM